ncbi:serine/threonine protein kinase [Microtetraspora sp. NBRC 13810]|uniref:serine/threonine-protein kinase n=1 Tax=Microtetraspora sp. NBRC 13810 TaxID=3030990 RepID=UPI002554EE59|nr:serine/threonine protein kinase [Microtetraspora sp. NBRC 13810]
MNDDRLGPYRLLRRLGEGGMGVVHLATDPQGREVAVKVLRAEVAGDDVARRRLAREVETMRRVRSEHIAEVLDADVTGHRPYIVTRYVPGRPLDDLVKQDGPLDLEGVLKVAGGVASALAAVHSVGVIHRDLKPGNVLIVDGEPVLIDFGIAQAVDATRLTQTGMFIGTPGYLAPEIIEGQVAGPEVDVHAWAGTLLYACSGQPPFGKGTLEMVFYNITAGKANIDAAPEILRPLLRAALRRDPAKRPQAAELAEQCARLMPRPARHRVPDDIPTVPEFDSRGRADEIPTPPVGPSRAAVLAAQEGPAPDRPAPDRPAADREYVSLLGEQAPPAPAGDGPLPEDGDPWPTRRVTPEELRQVRSGGSDLPAPVLPGEPVQGSQAWQAPGASQMPSRPWDQPEEQVAPSWEVPTEADVSAVPSVSWDVPTQADVSATPSRPWEAPAAGPVPPAPPSPSPDGDIPTQRVRPSDLQEYIRNHQRPPHGQAAPYGTPDAQVTPAYGQGKTPAPPAHGHGAAGLQGPPAPANPRTTGGHDRPGHERSGLDRPGHEQAFGRPGQPSAPYPHPYQQPQPPAHGRGHDPAFPGHEVRTANGAARPLQRSKAYGAAAVLLLGLVAALAIIAPVLVSVVVIPLAVLLRAADIAHPQLGGQGNGGAALDVLRVLGRPAALVKSVVITVALVPYALILGLPVTLLLTVLVSGMETSNALSWGVAVALWTICAGPGVEGPGRQMRRALASLVPAKNVAVAVAAAVAVAVALTLAVAVGTLGERTTSVWSPVNIQPIANKLEALRTAAQ